MKNKETFVKQEMINENSKGDKYSADCQLVTTINAYYYLTNNIIEQKSEQYKELAELGGCCYGSCLSSIKKVWSKLGIIEDKRFNINDLQLYLKPNCFIEANVWHKKYGFHSIAIVDYLDEKQKVKVTNFKYETKNNWISLKKLKTFIVLNPNKDEPLWEFRTFKNIEND